MRDKNAVRVTLAGLGVGAGAILAAAVIPVATASADDDIDGHFGVYDSNVTTSSSGPAIDIFNNRGVVETSINGTAPNADDQVTIENNGAGSEIITTINGTGTGAQNLVNIDDNVGTTDTIISGGSGAGSATEAFIDGNSGAITTKITDGTPISATIADNTGHLDITSVTDSAGGDITLSGNTDWQDVQLFGTTGTYDIDVLSGSAPVNIDDALEFNTSPLYVGVDAGTLGTVTADVGGVVTLIPAGDEYEFVNGAVDVLSTSF